MLLYPHRANSRKTRLPIPWLEIPRAERVDNAGFPGIRVLAECKSTKATHEDASSLLAGSFN
jgi:hypothetical protein